MISNDDAYFYKVLCQSGFVDEYHNWINEYFSKADTYSGIILDLAESGSDINRIISCLHNYLLNMQIDERNICDRLRNFVLLKFNNENITVAQCVRILKLFLDASDKMYEDYWSDFYLFCCYLDLVEDNLLSKEKYDFFFIRFLKTGLCPKSERFWGK